MNPLHSKPHCLVCGQRPTKAISIAGFLVCETCESRIAKSHPNDPDYDELALRLRELWHGLAEAAASRE